MSLEIRKGQKAKPVGKQGIMSRRQADFCLAGTGALANFEIIRGQGDAFYLTPNKAILQLRETSSTTSSLGMHPFKIYPTGEVDSGGNIGYQIRTGIVEFRPLFHLPSDVNWFATVNSQGAYGTWATPDNTDGADVPDQDKIISPATFFLDPTPEIDSGVNYGAYYSWWTRIAPDTDNGSSWDGSVSIEYHRFSQNALTGGSSVYDGYMFPALPDLAGYENLPIGILQLVAGDSPMFGINGTDGEVFQVKRDNYTGRFTAGQNGLNGFNYQGDWIVSGGSPVGTPGIASGNRVYYPGDLIRFENLDSPSSQDGVHLWINPTGQLGGTPTGPYDGASGFIQISEGTF